MVSPQQRAAVALSNMGVSLLERGAYRQASDAFRGDMFALKLVCSSRTCSTYHDSGKIVDTKLQQTNRNLANARAKPYSKKVVNVKTISQYDSISTVNSAVKDSDFAVAFPIRIEVTDTCSTEELNLDLAFSIMLHNAGVCYFCLSKVSSNVRCSSNFRERAVKALSMSYSLLRTKRNTKQQSMERTDRLVVSIFVVLSIIGVLDGSGKSLEAKQFYPTLSQLRNAILELKGLKLLSEKVQTAAAA